MTAGQFDNDFKFVPKDPSTIAHRKLLEKADGFGKNEWRLTPPENDVYVFEREDHPQVIFIYSPEMNVLSARIQYNGIIAHKTMSCGYSGMFSEFIDAVFARAAVPFTNIKIEELEH